MTTPTIKNASVRVMHSFDYCHFEVTLGTNPGDIVEPADVDALRKEAARLCDKAVAQYKVAKAAAQDRENAGWDVRRSNLEHIKEIRAMVDTDRSPEQQAILKAHDDAVFRRNRVYDYEDDWDDFDEHDDEDE